MQRLYDSDVIRSMSMYCEDPLVRLMTLAMVLMGVTVTGILVAVTPDASAWGILALYVFIGMLIVAPKHLWMLFTYCGTLFTGIMIEPQGPFVMVLLALLCFVLAAFARKRLPDQRTVT